MKRKGTGTEQYAGERIYHLRLDRGYSRERLAELAGLSEKFIYQIEIKHTGFSASTLKHLAEALGVSSDYILNGCSFVRMDGEIGELLEKFEYQSLEKVEELLRIIYELSLLRS